MAIDTFMVLAGVSSDLDDAKRDKDQADLANDVEAAG